MEIDVRSINTDGTWVTVMPSDLSITSAELAAWGIRTYGDKLQTIERLDKLGWGNLETEGPGAGQHLQAIIPVSLYRTVGDVPPPDDRIKTTSVSAAFVPPSTPWIPSTMLDSVEARIARGQNPDTGLPIASDAPQQPIEAAAAADDAAKVNTGAVSFASIGSFPGNPLVLVLVLVVAFFMFRKA